MTITQRKNPTEASIETEVTERSLKTVFLDPLNKDAISAFSFVALSLLFIPMGLYVVGNQLNWSLEIWGVCSVIILNILMGCYSYYVYVEEKSFKIT